VPSASSVSALPETRKEALLQQRLQKVAPTALIIGVSVSDSVFCK